MSPAHLMPQKQYIDDSLKDCLVTTHLTRLKEKNAFSITD